MGSDGAGQVQICAKEDTWRRRISDYVKNQVCRSGSRSLGAGGDSAEVVLSRIWSQQKPALNDPDFTRGMSEEDKATLHDLSHLHVGGAPDPPSNEQ
jgi:hypothetical protein